MLNKDCGELTTGIGSISDWDNHLLSVLGSEDYPTCEQLPDLQAEIDWLCETFIYDRPVLERELKAEGRGRIDLGEDKTFFGQGTNEFAFSEDGSMLAILVDKKTLEFVNQITGEKQMRFFLVGLDPQSYIKRFYYIGKDLILDFYTIDPEKNEVILARRKINEALLSSSAEVVEDEIMAKDLVGNIYLIDEWGRISTTKNGAPNFEQSNERVKPEKMVSFEHFLIVESMGNIFVWDSTTGEIIFQKQSYDFACNKEASEILFFDEESTAVKILNLETMAEKTIIALDKKRYAGEFSGGITYDKSRQNILITGVCDEVTAINIPRRRVISKFKTDFGEKYYSPNIGYTNDNEIIVSGRRRDTETKIFKLPGLEKYQ